MKTIKERLYSAEMTKEDFKKILEDMGDEYFGILGLIPGKTFIKVDPNAKKCKKCEKNKVQYTVKINECYTIQGINITKTIFYTKQKCSNLHEWEFENVKVEFI